MARLPKRYVRFHEQFPEVGKAYEAYGEAIAQAGPLDGKSRCLVKLGMSIAARMGGAAKSHAHKALQAGCTPDEIRHVALLAAPTVGFPNMMAGLGWVDEILAGRESD